MMSELFSSFMVQGNKVFHDLVALLSSLLFDQQKAFEYLNDRALMMNIFFVLIVAIVILFVLNLLLWQIVSRLPLPHGRSPPVVSGWIPMVGCGLDFVKAPRDFLQSCRASYGDTFLLRMFGMNLFFVFSPVGVKSLYQISEREASFAEATRGLLGLKLPSEIIAEGGLNKFHQGLRTNLVKKYIVSINGIVDDSIHSLDQAGSFEVFEHMKGLVHKLGFLSWVGPDALKNNYLPRLIAAFEVLDPESGFKDLSSVFRTILTFKKAERKAIKDMENILREIWEAKLERNGGTVSGEEDNLSSLHELYRDLPEAERFRRVAYDVFQFHVASQANMYAAVSWTLISLLQRNPAHIARVIEEIHATIDAHGDAAFTDLEVADQLSPYLRCVIQESLRLAQQSITLRKTMQEVSFRTEAGEFTVPQGYYLATILNITNLDEGHLPHLPPLNEFHPQRYQAGNLSSNIYSGDVKYLISTFGHGFHACPGFRFAMAVIQIIVGKYVLALRCERLLEPVLPPPTSVGAIARAQKPCYINFAKQQ